MNETQYFIVILERGYIKVVEVEGDPTQYALWLPYKTSRIIRRWGTTNGLAELCGGPTSATVLDKMTMSGTVPIRAVIDIMSVDQDKWRSHMTTTTPVVKKDKRAVKSPV